MLLRNAPPCFSPARGTDLLRPVQVLPRRCNGPLLQSSGGDDFGAQTCHPGLCTCEGDSVDAARAGGEAQSPDSPPPADALHLDDHAAGPELATVTLVRTVQVADSVQAEEELARPNRAKRRVSWDPDLGIKGLGEDSPVSAPTVADCAAFGRAHGVGPSALHLRRPSPLVGVAPPVGGPTPDLARPAPGTRASAGQPKPTEWGPQAAGTLEDRAGQASVLQPRDDDRGFRAEPEYFLHDCTGDAEHSATNHCRTPADQSAGHAGRLLSHGDPRPIAQD